MTLTPYDSWLVDPIQYRCTLFFEGYGESIEFQFPPRIPSDNRTYKWKESDAYGFEPILSFQGNGPRSITLKWQYIVESEEYDPYSDKWTIGRIKRMINVLRAYHSYSVGTATAITGFDRLVCRLRIAGIAGPGENDGGLIGQAWTVAMTGINITHSDTYIGPREYAFPLSTNITADLKLWVSNSLLTSSSAPDSIVNIRSLRPRPEIEDYWY